MLLCSYVYSGEERAFRCYHFQWIDGASSSDGLENVPYFLPTYRQMAQFLERHPYSPQGMFILHEYSRYPRCARSILRCTSALPLLLACPSSYFRARAGTHGCCSAPPLQVPRARQPGEHAATPAHCQQHQPGPVLLTEIDILLESSVSFWPLRHSTILT